MTGGRQEARNISLVTYLLLAAALVCGVSFRAVGIAGKSKLIHDEPISYMSATGHEGEYTHVIREQVPPFGVWAEASEWKRFVRVERAFCFKTIGADLARHDIHPPLYFWLLHVWCLVFGVHVWTGPALNVLFTLLSTVALFSMGRYVLRDALAGALVAFVWNVSPNVLETGLDARQYDLLALCTILFVWRVIRCTDPEEPCGFRQLTLLALSTAMGLLTHYHFTILVAGGGVFALWRLARRHRRRLAGMCAAVAVGIVILAALHPGFVGSIQQGRNRTQPVTSEPVSLRMNRVLSCYTGFFVDNTSFSREDRRAVQYAVLAGVVAMALMLAGSWAFARFGRRPHGDGRFVGSYIVYFLLWSAGTNILLFLMYVSPKHAMTARYPAMVWPFYAFLPVLVLATMRRGRLVATVLLCLGMTLAGAQGVRVLNRMDASLVSPVPLLHKARQVIVDNVRMNALPRAVWLCPDDLMVFGASQTHFLEHQDAWLDHLDPPTLYVSPRGRDSTKENHAAILRVLTERFEVAQMPRWFWNLGVCYWITEKP